MRARRIASLVLAAAVWTASGGGAVLLRPAVSLAAEPAIGAVAPAVAALASTVVASEVPSGSIEPTVPPSTDATLTLLAVGDIMCHAAQLQAARTRGGYSFLEAFSPLQQIISGADIAVGNLETTLSDRSFSGYPAFKTPRQFADAIKWAGFDVLSTANNHTLDGGARGVRYTTSYLDRIGIAHFGSNNVAPIVVEKNGIKIAFASYTYSSNGIRSPFRSAVNRINLARMRADIQAVRPTVDLVVVFMHWGTEYSTSIERATRSQGRYIIDSGADLVLGSHPHVVRPVEQYKGRYIVYSMGNFLSGQSKNLTDLGTMVTADVIKRDGVTTVSGMKVLPVFRDRSSGAGRRTYRTVLLGRNDRLISKADRSRMATYKTFCKRMFRGYY
jgi:poly-gamma-glutamate capsule biosynthesis protein CapA/YwtB (metallophosphatase superfamily)